MSLSGSLNHSWFALHVKPRHEKTTARALSGKGFEEFLPLCRTKRNWSDRIKELDEPLFPNYVFCRLNPLNRMPVLSTPGVFSIVGAGKLPLPIAEAEIAALQAIVASGALAQPWPFLEVGHHVKVDAGPLSGLEGILLDFKGSKRLVVSVTILQRSVAVEIDRLDVSPLRAARSPVARASCPAFVLESKSA